MTTCINLSGKKVRIVEVRENGKKYWIVQRRLLWFLWDTVGGEMSNWDFDTLEEAQKCAKEVSEESTAKRKVVTL